MIPEFHPGQTGLTRGSTLIEASAGTGKTYTITAIYLRLILEAGLEVPQILVTTYTEAATGELRDRIRTRLTSALEAFQRGTSDDALLAQFLPASLSDSRIDQLQRALRDFDQAAIFTIHGFCQRMLRERALESGLPFDAELVTDQDSLLSELVDDYWRREYGSASSFIGSLCQSSKISPESLLGLLREIVHRPLLTVIPSFAAGELERLKVEADELFQSLRSVWRTDGEEIRNALIGPPEWAGRNRKLGREATLRRWFHLLDESFSPPADSTDGFAVLAELCPARIEAACKKGATAPSHAFFGLCEKYSNLNQSFALVAQTHFIDWARSELQRRKTEQNILSFDDLLTRLHNALQSDGASELTSAIQARYQAALIDEFQDTDGIQEAIFQQLFGGGESYLYLIGDPKQAIYGFRGADIFSYLSAANSAKHSFTLRTNRRSVSRLVAGVNAVFSRANDPFIFPEINFTPVEASGDRDSTPLLRAGRTSPPFRIWTYRDGAVVPSGEANRELPRLTAIAIAKLLGERATIGERPVRPSDISVLVAKHFQAKAIQDALREFRIPSVLLSDQSIWETYDAFEIHVVLAAVAEPTREDKVRAAFATELLGGTASALDKYTQSEADWQAALLRFNRYHERWWTHGFTQMFRALILGEHVRVRLLRLPDGDRRLTNILHLAELLHRESTSRQLVPSALLRWLETNRYAARPPRDEESVLRLERDDDAVQVITMHRSKGLEFNIVFCPFSWGQTDQKRADNLTIFHDEANGRRLTLDLGSPDEKRSRAILAREQLAEEARLLYVTLTRAIHECHFTWGRFAKCGVSAAGWLLHQPSNCADSVAALTAHAESMDSDSFSADLRSLEQAAPDSIAIRPLDEECVPKFNLPSETAERDPHARPFRSWIDREWGISSFSSLIYGTSPEAPDRDTLTISDEIVANDHTNELIHQLPGGSRTGLCLHKVLEDIEFDDPATVEPAVRTRLAEFSFDATFWTKPVSDMILQTLAVENPAGFQLSSVARDRRLAEVEFHLPAARLQPQDLKQILADEVGDLVFAPRKGWLKGVLDAVVEHEGRFYVIDWKSNRQALQSGGYSQSSIHAAMVTYSYTLQLHLYIAALDRYLRTRLEDYSYERHCGGAFYYFVRGCNSKHPGSGIYYRRPSAQTIERLGQWLNVED